MKGVDYGTSVGVYLKNSGVVWFDLVVVTHLSTLIYAMLLVGIALEHCY